MDLKILKYFLNFDQILKDWSTFEKILIVGWILIFNKNLDRPNVVTIHGLSIFLLKIKIQPTIKTFSNVDQSLKFDQHLKNI